MNNEKIEKTRSVLSIIVMCFTAVMKMVGLVKESKAATKGSETAEGSSAESGETKKKKKRRKKKDASGSAEGSAEGSSAETGGTSEGTSAAAIDYYEHFKNI